MHEKKKKNFGATVFFPDKTTQAQPAGFIGDTPLNTPVL